MTRISHNISAALSKVIPGFGLAALQIMRNEKDFGYICKGAFSDGRAFSFKIDDHMVAYECMFSDLMEHLKSSIASMNGGDQDG